MRPEPNSQADPRELIRLLVVYWRRWASVTALATTAAVVYALTSPKAWQASQALIVRNEAVGGESEAAKMRAAEDVKGIQETILELAKSRSLLKAALVEAGPPAGYAGTAAWPADKEVESFKKDVKVAPPKGVEFGSTEVFYLEVQNKDRARAAALNSAVSHQLQLALQEVRNAKAQSMIDELDKSVFVAQSDLQAATKQLTALEKEVGSDLPELRSLSDANAGDTSLRRTVTEIENEVRQYQGTERFNRQLLDLLKEAQADPTRLIVAPNRLLESQPALRRLKDGLVDAQLRTATLQGRMSSEHPEVLAAKEAEGQVAQRLHAELAAAVRGLELELSFDANRLEVLENQRASAAARLARLAGMRAHYTNLLNEVTNRAKLFDRAEQSLAAARSDRASSKAASLIACVDAPDTGSNPISPSKLMIVLGGALAGLLTGIGIVLLTAPAAAGASEKMKPESQAMPAPAAAAKPGEVAQLSDASSGPQNGAPLAPLDEAWTWSVTADAL